MRLHVYACTDLYASELFLWNACKMYVSKSRSAFLWVRARAASQTCGHVQYIMFMCLHSAGIGIPVPHLDFALRRNLSPALQLMEIVFETGLLLVSPGFFICYIYLSKVRQLSVLH